MSVFKPLSPDDAITTWDGRDMDVIVRNGHVHSPAGTCLKRRHGASCDDLTGMTVAERGEWYYTNRHRLDEIFTGPPTVFNAHLKEN